MTKTVKWILLSLCFCDYQVVRIRVKGVRGIIDSGKVGKILEKYGDYPVLCSSVVDDALILTIQDDNYTDCSRCVNCDTGQYGVYCMVENVKYNTQHCPYFKKGL